MKQECIRFSILCILFVLFCFQPALAAPIELSLETSIAMALQNNPTMKIAEANRGKSAFAVKQAQAGKGLAVSLTHTALRSDMPKSYQATLAPISPYNYFKTQLNFSLSLYSGGKLESTIDQAKLNQKVSELNIHLDRQELKLAVTTAYYNVLQTRNLLEVANRSVDDFSAHLKNVQKQYDAGTVALPDLLQTKVRLANAQNGLIKAQNSHQLAIYNFNTIVVLPLYSEIKLNDQLKYQHYAINFDSCVTYALDKRPDMEQARTNISLTNTQVKIAQSNKRPSVDLNLTNAWDDVDWGGTKNGKWGVILTTKWDIFNSGLTNSQIKQAEYSVTAANEQARQVNDKIVLEVSQAYQSIKEAEKRIETNEIAIEQAEVDFKLSQERYEAGVGTNLDVMDGELALTQAKTNYIQALYDYNTSKAQLDKAMGIAVQ